MREMQTDGRTVRRRREQCVGEENKATRLQGGNSLSVYRRVSLVRK